MSDPLASAKYGVTHAKGHIANFDAQCVAYLQRNPCEVVIERGFGPAQHIHKIKLVKPIPIGISFMAFDALVNLRSSLDQAGYAVAIASGNTGEKAHFPFGQDRGEAESRYVTKKGKPGSASDLPKEIFDLMISFQPYQGGDDALWAMNRLCNDSKHEVVSPMAFGSSGLVGSITPDGLTHGIALGQSWDRVKNEIVFAMVGLDSNPKYKLKITAFIAISDVGAVRGKEATTFLYALASKVDGILMAIEAESRRLGYFK